MPEADVGVDEGGEHAGLAVGEVHHPRTPVDDDEAHAEEAVDEPHKDAVDDDCLHARRGRRRAAGPPSPSPSYPSGTLAPLGLLLTVNNLRGSVAGDERSFEGGRL